MFRKLRNLDRVEELEKAVSELEHTCFCLNLNYIAEKEKNESLNEKYIEDTDIAKVTIRDLKKEVEELNDLVKAIEEELEELEEDVKLYEERNGKLEEELAETDSVNRKLLEDKEELREKLHDQREKNKRLRKGMK